MIKLVLQGFAVFLVSCSGDPMSFETSVRVRLQRSTWQWDNSLSCYNYARYSATPYFIAPFYSATYKVEVDLDTATYKNQVLSTDIYCVFTILGSGEFASLLDYSTLDPGQPTLNGSMTLTFHAEDTELVWVASHRCLTERPPVFLEIKEYNLSFRYFNIPAKLIEFLNNVEHMYCTTRIY